MGAGLKLAAAALALTGLTGVAEAGNSAVVIMYHRFAEDRYPSTSIRLDQFEAHLRALSEGGYEVVPLAKVVAALRGGAELPERAVAITIDDAYKSLYEVAWPRFKAAGIPVTLFVNTDAVDAGLSGSLSWHEIREMVGGGLEIGGHGAAHLHMAEQSDEANRADMARSLERIGAELGLRPRLFAWPYGEASAAAIAVAKEFGIEAAFGQHSGIAFPGADMHYLPRFPLNEHYGEIERLRTVIRAMPLPVSDLVPADPLLEANPPPFGFTVAEGVGPLANLSCFASHDGRMVLERIGRRVEARAARPFPPGRGRINCTMPGEGGWHWFGYQYVVPEAPAVQGADRPGEP